MKSSSKGPRIKQQLSESFMSNVNAYALAAGAAGVSIMALAQPAEAEIVYTPANATIPINRGVTIDLTHDGTADFRFFFYTFAYHSFRGELSVYGVNGGGVIAGAGKYASPLFRGKSIGPAQVFVPGAEMFRSQGVDIYSSIYHRSVFGPWVNVQNRYLGVEFLIDGATHYGWIRLSSTVGKFKVATFTVTGYAYETVPDQPIKAGQLTDEASAPAESAPLAKPSLGVLALGSQGLELWRRDGSSLSAQ
ncbi:MAG: hypothetical protein WCA49_22595 [Candidatus Sulfotelmatobacter sp.]